jgi:ubiquitin-protein ligase
MCMLTTQVYHLNFRLKGSGRICIDILGSEWSRALELGLLLVSLTAMLDAPPTNNHLIPETRFSAAY